MTKYRNLKTLMLDAFMDALLQQQYECIVEEGTPTPEELSREWGRIINEYYALLGDGNYKHYLATSGRVEDKKAKIYCIVNTVNFLFLLSENGMTSPALLEDLKQWGYPVVFKTEEQYMGDLELIFTRLKREERQLKGWIEEIQQDKKKGGKITEDHFGDVMAAIADVLKVVIEPTRTSVWSYVFLVKRLRQATKTRTSGRV